MATIIDIVSAIGDLAIALPGSSGIVNVSLHACDASGLQAFVEAGATVDRYANDARTEEWDSATIRVGKASVTAYGYHRKLAPAATLDESADAALARAAEVLA